MVENLFTLGMLVLLQIVLGFDNLLYISLESKTAPPDKQAFVRKLGIGLAIFLRIALLFILLALVETFKTEIFACPDSIKEYFDGHFTIHSLIVLFGGGFIMYTAIKEIWHMISIEEHGATEEKRIKPVWQSVMMIVIMNLVFSFDSILSAMALTEVKWVMATAIIIGGLLMILLADKVSEFLAKNRMYEVLGLFILFLVGIMLLTEGGHLAHIRIMGNPIVQMSKATFYFVLVVLVLVDVVQGRYQRKLVKEKQKQAKEHNNIG